MRMERRILRRRSHTVVVTAASVRTREQNHMVCTHIIRRCNPTFHGSNVIVARTGCARAYIAADLSHRPFPAISVK